MKFFITKKSLERFFFCQKKGLTRNVVISTFRQYDDKKREIEMKTEEFPDGEKK